MFSSNGLINIKNILIVNIILSLVITFILFNKIGEIKKLSINLNCDGLETIGYLLKKHKGDMSDMDPYKSRATTTFNPPQRSYVLTICNKYLNKDKFEDNILIFEPDNETYIKNFILLNIIASEKDKLINKIKETDIEKNIFEFQRYSILFKILDENKSHKSRSTLEPISKIYNLIFDSSKFSYDFLNFLNFTYFIICLILVYLILKRTFNLKDRLILCLISLNICVFPLFFIYFLTFYKEPVILVSSLLILANFVFFYKQSNTWKYFAVFALMFILSFQLVNIYKPIYLLIFLSSLLIASIFIIYKLKKLRQKYYVFLKVFIVLIFSFNFHNDIIKKIHTQNIKAKEDTLNYIKKSNDKYFQFLKNYYIDPVLNTYFITIDDLKIKRETATNDKLKAVKDIEMILSKNRKRSDGKEFDRVRKKNKHLFSDPAGSKSVGYEPINCFFINKLYCKRFNNIFFRIYSIKNDTLKENFGNSNLINNFRYHGTLDILINIPFSLKGYVMPILINSDLKVISLSLFKIFLSMILVFILYKLLSNKKKQFFEIIILQIIIFLPLIILINLVTSNFFTYHRYMFPFNVYIFLVIYGYLAKNFSDEKNQYNN